MAFSYNNNIKPLSISLSIFLICMICFSEEAISSSKLSSSSAPIVRNPSGEFLIKFQIGTPPVQVSGVADISTDLTWIQCGSSNNNNSIFDPTKSKTFRNITCGSDQCGLIEDNVHLDCYEEQQPCGYRDLYGDGNYGSSSGHVASETFTLDQESSNSPQNNNKNNSYLAFPEVVFGCGYENEGKPTYTGVVGLGRGPTSIVRQFGGSKFSYCLTTSNNNNNNKIRFGNDAVVTGPNVVSTPLKKGESMFEAPYYVRLEGISVGNKRLEFKYEVGRSALRRFGNINVDFRTTNTMLPSGFYYQLESALVNGTSGGKRVPDPREGPAGLCYAAAAASAPINFPALTVHFEGADLVLPRQSTFVEVDGVFCLTFSPTATYGFPIFGKIQQSNFLIGFDLQNRKLDFLPTDCAKHH